MMSARADARTRPSAAIRADHSTPGPRPGLFENGAVSRKPLKNKTLGELMEPGLHALLPRDSLVAPFLTGRTKREPTGDLP